MHMCLSMGDSEKELQALCGRGPTSLQKTAVYEQVNLFVETNTF